MSALLLGLTLALSSAAPGLGDDAPSLEELLERARVERAARRLELEPAVVRGIDLFEELAQREVAARQDEEGELEPPGEEEIAAAIASLAELGEEAAPLLVPYLEPVTANGRRRAGWVREALARMPLEAALSGLVELGRDGGRDATARMHAISLLPLSDEPERVQPVLIELFREDPDERLCALAIAGFLRFGGQEVGVVVDEVLNDRREIVVAAALNGLTEGLQAQVEPQVRALVLSRNGSDYVPQLLAYYQAQLELVDDELMSAWIRLATRPGTREADKIRILVGLPGFGRRFEREWRDQMQPLVQSGDDDVSLEAEICLALLGDRTSRRELIERYDQWVAETSRYSKSWGDRGKLLLRLGDYRGAIRDFEQAIDNTRGSPQNQIPYWIELARAHIKNDDVRGAHDALAESPMQRSDRRALAADADFAPLLEHSRYGDILR